MGTSTKCASRLVFTIISSGYFPRCALDATDGAEIRVSKIATMIGECDWGIRDLSRIEIDAAGVPRFNMPMELGLHLGRDLWDIDVHGNDSDFLFAVRDWIASRAEAMA